MHESFVMYITIVLVKQDDFYKNSRFGGLHFFLELRTLPQKKKKQEAKYRYTQGIHFISREGKIENNIW